MGSLKALPCAAMHLQWIDQPLFQAPPACGFRERGGRSLANHAPQRDPIKYLLCGEEAVDDLFASHFLSASVWLPIHIVQNGRVGLGHTTSSRGRLQARRQMPSQIVIVPPLYGIR